MKKFYSYFYLINAGVKQTSQKKLINPLRGWRENISRGKRIHSAGGLAELIVR